MLTYNNICENKGKNELYRFSKLNDQMQLRILMLIFCMNTSCPYMHLHHFDKVVKISPFEDLNGIIKCVLQTYS